MKTYPKYKDSGIEWIGEIPEHWEKNRLKTNIDLLTGFPFKSQGYSKKGIKLARGINVKEKQFDWTETKYWPALEEDLEKYLLEKDDILIGMDGSKVGKNFCKVKEEDLPILLLQRVARLRTKDSLDANFLFFNIYCRNFLFWVNINKTDPMVPHIAPKDINNFVIALPPPSEQTTIANFLDHKTAQIDQSIAKQRTLIELLQEHRAAIINEAVTKGSNPEVPMKDSGVEWIGEIPAHWEVWKVGRAFNKISSGTTPKSGDPRYHKGGTINWINTGDLNDGLLKSCKKKITPKALEDYSTLKVYPANSLIVAMYGATIGKTSITTFEATTNQACCVLADSLVFDIWFAFYWFIANKQHIINMSVGGGQPNISQEIIRALKIPAPSETEQQQIVQYIETETTRIDQEIAATQKEIELLEEYRQSLIAEAVTGKIDVRDYVLGE